MNHEKIQTKTSNIAQGNANTDFHADTKASVTAAALLVLFYGQLKCKNSNHTTLLTTFAHSLRRNLKTQPTSCVQLPQQQANVTRQCIKIYIIPLSKYSKKLRSNGLSLKKNIQIIHYKSKSCIS